MVSRLTQFVCSIFLFFCIFSAHAEHAAVAYVNGGGWGGWAVKATKQKAEASALQQCRDANPGEKCAIQYGVAISRAESQDRMGFSTSSKSKADAEKLALQNCGNPDCKIVWTKTKPGFYAAFQVMNKGEVSDYYLQYGADTGNWAIEEGKRNCEKVNGTECQVAAFGAIKGNFDVPKAAAPSKPAAAPASCRPNTSHIRCTSRCVNGDCTVTYENGCQIRVRVLPQFNGQSWVYPSPSC